MNSAGRLFTRLCIVTPSLNAAEFIGAAIRSVLDQDYPHIEYIVVDGGSTDGTIDIVKGLGDRLRLVSEPGLRQAGAINRGWAQSKGDILAWLNADDVYLPGALQAVAEEFAERPDLDILCGEAAFLDDRGGDLGSYPTQPFDYLVLLRSAVNFVAQPATFLRRRVLESYGPLREDLDYLMDFEYWLRVGRRAVVERRDRRLAGLRLHPRAKSLSARQGFGDELVRVYEGLFAGSDLPPDVARVRREALANARYLAADACFWAGALPAARRYALAALSTRPFRPPRGCLRLTALALAGSAGRRLAERQYRDPYKKIPLTAGKS